MTQSLAIVVIPAGCRHKLVDDRFQMFVTQGQVTPGLHAETGGIDMHVKPAAPVHFHVTQVKHPADLLQFPQAGFADQYRTDQFESVVTAYTAVRHELPMRTGGMVVAFYRNLDTGFPELACEPFTGTVVGLDLDTELAVESIIKGGSWDSERDDCRSEKSDDVRIGTQGYANVGFRVVRTDSI